MDFTDNGEDRTRTFPTIQKETIEEVEHEIGTPGKPMNKKQSQALKQALEMLNTQQPDLTGFLAMAYPNFQSLGMMDPQNRHFPYETDHDRWTVTVSEAEQDIKQTLVTAYGYLREAWLLRQPKPQQ